MLPLSRNTSSIIRLSVIDSLELGVSRYLYIQQEVYNEVVTKSNDQVIGKHGLRNPF